MTENAPSETATVVGPPQARAAIGAWLLACAALVVAVTVLGGVTRLTHSGLSIVTWEPISGVLPPMSEEGWQEEFAHYQQFPEYKLINIGMDLAGFKSIYWFEYSHRMAARLVGIAFALPFVYFVVRGWLRRRFAWQLFGILLLGGAQGALGWLMVTSGLADRPDVSHYRLTSHLGLAMVLYVVLIWQALRVLAPAVARRAAVVRAPSGFRRAALGAVGVVFLLVLSGGMVAGLDAGFAYNTFPKMNGEWVPAAIFEGWALDNIAAVQFAHRWLAVLVVALLVMLWVRAIRERLPMRAMWAFHGLAAAVLIQGLIGVLTLLYVVPVPLASAHQSAALAVLGLATAGAYLAGATSLRSAPAAAAAPK